MKTLLLAALAAVIAQAVTLQSDKSAKLAAPYLYKITTRLAEVETEGNPSHGSAWLAQRDGAVFKLAQRNVTHGKNTQHPEERVRLAQAEAPPKKAGPPRVKSSKKSSRR